MPLFKQWRPIALSRALGQKPASVAYDGYELVLFRDEAGQIGALKDRCPHRGMRLSLGRVSNGRLICPYHGWSFCPAGDAVSPGTPTLKLRAPALETTERYGVVWVREQGGIEDLPDHDEPGMRLVQSLTRIVRAPLASVMDNFTEVEHTGVSHWQFGYDPERMDQITIETQTDDENVRVRAVGPQRPLGLPARIGFGIGKGMALVCEWETAFAPPSTVWRWGWLDPRTGSSCGRRFKAVAYFNAISPCITQLVTFYYWSAHPFDRVGFAHLALPFMRLATDYELGRDIALIEGLAGNGTGIPPNGISRFDRPLVEQRRMLAQQTCEVSNRGAARDPR
jgi:phenylpropionate dioxygenase-like ring-hydroxylating dioxygenase large terminal subunit